MKKNIIILVAIVIAAVVLRFSYSNIAQFISGNAASRQKAPQVQAETITEESIIRSYEEPGRVTSKYRVDVLARISGYLQQSYFKEGDYVKKGQTLFLIEPAEFSNAAKVAKANVANLNAQLIYAEKQLARADELVKKDYIAKSQYDSMLSQRDSLKAQLASAQAAYSDAERSLGYTNVKSPVDGRVGVINVTIGNYVSPTSGALTTINSTNPIYVTFPLESTEFAAISASDRNNHKNRRVELILPNGQKYELDGVQDFQDNKVDQSTGTITMRATFQNPDNQLIHGEFVTVKLYANNPSLVPVVSQTAVQENQAGKYVYKLDENELPQLTYIKTSGQKDDKWIISEGLVKGDRVIVDGLQKVSPGKPVTLVTAEEMAKIKKAETDAVDKKLNKEEK